MSTPQEPAATAASARLDDIAALIDRVPGPTGQGLCVQARARLFAFLDTGAADAWTAARRLHVTRTLTLWVAAMRHGHVGMYQLPTLVQVTAALDRVADDCGR